MAKTERDDWEKPLVLIVPGLNNSGPRHWQTLWEREYEDCVRVELGMWEQPHRNTWVNKLNAAIHATNRPVILVAHSLGCHAVAWWNALERPEEGGKVVGALLVAPPQVEGPDIDGRIAGFSPVVRQRLPFTSILAASQNDPYIAFGQAKRLARIWGSRLVDVGPLGHINADSGIGDWPYGRYLLERLTAAVAPRPTPLLPGRNADLLTPHDTRLEIGR